MALAAGGMPRYTRERQAQLEGFEDRVLTPLAQLDQMVAEIEQERMRAQKSLGRFEVAIDTAQKLIRAWREREMDGFQYPYRRR